MRIPRRAAAVALVSLVSVLVTVGPSVGAQSASDQGGLHADPVLEQLIKESLASRPELHRAHGMARAERERVPQAGALPDPTLSLGIQNDGFGRLQIGAAETSWYSLELSQPLPWPGKLRLRTAVAALAADSVGAAIARAQLSAEADVRRAYLGLILARERLALLEQLDALWQKSAGIARKRYETGEGAQSDVLRAQLEFNRLRKRRWALQAEEQTQIQALNRLRARPLDEPIPTAAKVSEIETPRVEELETVLVRARAASPELVVARLGVSRAQTQTQLARRERFPDFNLSAGIMPRGGLEPMWRAGVGIGLPVWSYRKQSRAVRESDVRAAAEGESAEAVEQILGLRVAERRVALATLVNTIQLYRDGLLVQSQSTVESTLAQYSVGNVTFASVLDANAGYLSDQDDYLLTVADAQRIVIAEEEIALDTIGATLAGSGTGSPTMSGAPSEASAPASQAGASPSM